MIKKVEHVAIMADSMEDSIKYYSELFGFQLRSRGDNGKREMAFLFHKNQPEFEIELISDLVPNDSYSTKGIVNHLAFTVDNIDESVHFYKDKGVTFHTEHPKDALGGGRTIFFNGPSKELLQLVEPGER